MWYTRGELDRAHTRVTLGLTLADRAGDAYTASVAASLLGHIEVGLGNLEAARAGFMRGIDGFRALAIPWGLGNALIGAAWVALTNGEVDGARRLLDEATVVLRRAGPWFSGPLLCLRAILAVRLGKARDAIRLVGESLAKTRPLRDYFAFVYALVPLAAAAALSGDDEWATRLVAARHAITECTGATVVGGLVGDLSDRTEHEVRDRLGPERWARAYAAGRACAIDSVLNDIDSVLKKATQS